MTRRITKAHLCAIEASAIPPKAMALLTAAEAAHRLRVSIRSIDRFQQKGLLPGYSVGGSGHRRFRADDVDQLLVPDQSVDQQSVDLDSFISTHIKRD